MAIPRSSYVPDQGRTALSYYTNRNNGRTDRGTNQSFPSLKWNNRRLGAQIPPMLSKEVVITGDPGKVHLPNRSDIQRKPWM
jgi:hypothetical protein